jgi:hypothetical protein
MTWELLDRPGEPPKSFAVTGDKAVNLFNKAVDAAKAVKLPWPEAPVELKPSNQLVELVRRSQLDWTKEDADAGAK